MCTSIPAMWYGIGLSSWERRACLVASIRDRELSPRETGDAQLFGQSCTLCVKQLLGLACSMANLVLAAPRTDILTKLRFSCPFAGLQAQPQPGAEIVPDTPPVLLNTESLTFEKCPRIPASWTATSLPI